jgi:hypothetical protein
MKRFPIAVAVAAFALMGASSAFATGPKIDGVVTQTVDAEKNNNTATGNGSLARQVFGTINADVSGTVTQTVTAKENNNTAQGNDSEACQAFGVIGPVEDACGKH